MLDKKMLLEGKTRWEPIDNVKMDWAGSTGIYMVHFLSYQIYKTPQVLFLTSIFTELGYIILVFMIVLIPMIIFTIIEMIRAKITKKDENYAIINTSVGFLHWLFIIGFPINIFQLILFIITILVVYVGIYERFPIIKLNLKFRRLYKLGYDSTKELFSSVDVSTTTLYIAEMVYMLASSFKIYPVPFLILIEARYFIRKLVFPDRLIYLEGVDEEDKEKYNKKFYKRWESWSDLSVYILAIPLFITVVLWVLKWGGIEIP
ncbi:MAG: hypothetical protein ACTSRP_20375 [Candidatus Helarchaeota archaeon]